MHKSSSCLHYIKSNLLARTVVVRAKSYEHTTHKHKTEFFGEFSSIYPYQ